ncbi:hypothetical protein O3P69_017286 [Scylla paramamosain]|uniref:Alanyl-tRNA synthetase class IIc N-terminal domain-containing protein n=1 Tax=Scylla paramamosain TaxID=85552 RepID=A0AAW0TWH3_SCYPA
MRGGGGGIRLRQGGKRRRGKQTQLTQGCRLPCLSGHCWRKHRRKLYHHCLSATTVMMQWGRGLLRVVWGAPVWVVAGRALHWPANKVRSTFLQYFENLDHHVVSSSPVIPWNDRTLTYVNAGMNQFKPVFPWRG